MGASHRFNADCLTSARVVGRLCSKKELITGESNQEALVIWTERLNTVEIMELLNNKLVKGVIVNKGSFAGHAAGFLNGRGVQLAICAQFQPIATENGWVLIDGGNNVIELSSERTQVPVLEIEPKIELKELYGERLKVYVDGKDEKELEAGFVNGADGVGILKTDWMNWNNDYPPSLEDHLVLYDKCLEKVGDKRLNVRLFDVGGDKIPKWANSAYELIKSPIGFRGIRAFEVLSQAYKTQIEALGIIAKKAKIGVVLPMVTNVEEVRLIKDEFKKLAADSWENIVWGIMVEIPEAALTIGELLGESDFVRLGPGDLSQACLAMDRDNIPPKYYSRSNLSPGVIKLIKLTADECKRQGKEINICQDVEPDIGLIGKIISAGVDSFCVSHTCVEHMKKIVNAID